MKLRLDAEIAQECDGTFMVKLSVGHIKSMAQASEIGQALDQALRAYFAGKGAELTRDDSRSPNYQSPGGLILPLQ